MPTWADFIIDMERSTPRNHTFQGEYLFGDILVHSELELSRQKIQDKCEKKIDLSNLTVAINFGGSQKVMNYFNKLKHIFLAHEEVSFYIYCPLALRKEVSLLFFELDNVKVEAFKSNYLQELPKYDLLITNTGTSFLEGLFVNIPMIIFSLFPNAIHNFDRFHKEELVLFSGTSHQLEVLDLTEAIKILYAKSDSHKSESNAESNLISIGLMEIQASLSKILK
jgi:spore coat polysaccharide biosynthesis predicted glycosyltransferase SpsG